MPGKIYQEKLIPTGLPLCSPVFFFVQETEKKLDSLEFSEKYRQIPECSPAETFLFFAELPRTPAEAPLSIYAIT